MSAERDLSIINAEDAANPSVTPAQTDALAVKPVTNDSAGVSITALNATASGSTGFFRRGSNITVWDSIARLYTLLKDLKLSWSMVSRLRTTIWLQLLQFTVIVSLSLEQCFKKLHTEASKASIKVEKKLKNWDKGYDWHLDSAGPLITELAHADIETCAEDVTSKADYQVLCTYSWKNTPLGERTPTIYVPGFARRFRSELLPGDTENFPPVEVNMDTGDGWVDQNSARSRQYQFEPTLRALAIMNPKACLDDVDIIIHRSVIMILYNLVNGKHARPLCIECKSVANTLVIAMKGNRGVARAAPESYGRNFETVFTQSSGEEDSDGYHHAIKYPMGPLNVVVRFEADAYLDGENTESKKQTRTCMEPKSIHEGIKTADLLYMTESPLSVVPSGVLIDQSVIVELKTTHKGEGAMVTKSIQQAWFGRTAQLVVGKRGKRAQRTLDDGIVQVYGTFSTARIHDLSSRLVGWENDEQNQLKLKKLTGLLQTLQDLARQSKFGKIVVRKLDVKDPIEIYEAKADMSEAFPKTLMDMFWGNHKA